MYVSPIQEHRKNLVAKRILREVKGLSLIWRYSPFPCFPLFSAIQVAPKLAPKIMREIAFDAPHDWGKRLLNQLAIGGVKSNLFFRGTSVRRSMGFLPQTQVLKDLSNDVPLVNEANDSFRRSTWGRQEDLFRTPC